MILLQACMLNRYIISRMYCRRMRIEREYWWKCKILHEMSENEWMKMQVSIRNALSSNSETTCVVPNFSDFEFLSIRFVEFVASTINARDTVCFEALAYTMSRNINIILPKYSYTYAIFYSLLMIWLLCPSRHISQRGTGDWKSISIRGVKGPML